MTSARHIARSVLFALRRPDMAWHRLRGNPLVEITLGEVEQALGGPPAVVFEAGCHVGSDTVAMAQTWPNALIHATEPLPDGVRAARNASAAYANVTVADFALSDVSGDATMRVSGGECSSIGSASSTLLPVAGHEDAFPEVHFRGTLSVSCRTLDEWFSDYGMPDVDLLWLDVQGMELAVLSSSPDALHVTRAVHVEVARRELFEGSGLARDVHDFMTASGFRRVIDRVGPIYGNVLYVR